MCVKENPLSTTQQHCVLNEKNEVKMCKAEHDILRSIIRVALLPKVINNNMFLTYNNFRST